MSRRNTPQAKASRRIEREERKEGVRESQDATNAVAAIRGNREARRWKKQ